MENKNKNITLFILAGLIILSFGFFTVAQQGTSTQNIFLDSDQDGLSDQEEKLYGTDPQNKDTDGDGYSDGVEIKSGYDPLKKAPGDKIVTSNNDDASAKTTGNINLTDTLAKNVSSLIASGTTKDATGNSGVSINDLDKLISEALAKKQNPLAAVEFKKEDLKIKKQEYKGLSEEKKKEKIKEDFSNYSVSIFYILCSNSSKPITSGKEALEAINLTAQSVMDSINSKNASKLDDLSVSGDKMLEQLKEVEVPEQLVDLHLKALRFAQQAKEIRKLITPSTDDPMGDLVNLYQMKAFFENLYSFIGELESKGQEYNLGDNTIIQDQMKNLGIDLSDTANLSGTVN